MESTQEQGCLRGPQGCSFVWNRSNTVATQQPSDPPRLRIRCPPCPTKGRSPCRSIPAVCSAAQRITLAASKCTCSQRRMRQTASNPEPSTKQMLRFTSSNRIAQPFRDAVLQMGTCDVTHHHTSPSPDTLCCQRLSACEPASFSHPSLCDVAVWHSNFM